MVRKKVRPKKEKVVLKTEPKEDLTEIAKKRSALISLIKEKLLSKSQLKRGGFGIRERLEAEKGYIGNIREINALGKKLGVADIGLGTLRRN